MPSFDDVQVNVSIEFDVYCHECGGELNVKTSVSSGYRGQSLSIEADPCDTCINKAREEGREEAEVSL